MTQPARYLIHLHDLPVGPVTLAATDQALLWLKFGIRDYPGAAPASNPVLEAAARQLREYFAGDRRTFELPLAPEGTEFQRRVWDALCTIPYGETWSYAAVGRAIGNPKAARAVGMANNRNPISIIIPCHRVIGANGALVGYGSGLPIKETLLRLEGALD